MKISKIYIALVSILGMTAWAWNYRVDIFLFIMTPQQEFEDHPPAPDYNLVDNWGSHPKKEDDSKVKPVDVFFIHPTSFRSATTWNDHVPSTDSFERYW